MKKTRLNINPIYNITNYDENTVRHQMMKSRKQKLYLIQCKFVNEGFFFKGY
jgi:hypothetical protein